ncbi:UDP-D-apiose/UDP-D-xylose synthase 2 [Zostera marina]|uniref:UDP-D-apiose/UDP-D-xylose synthase 2 n=1 Tax=Zostera marina TaxID=29655 RepID=A0A0K9P2M5_ZOSMR|nr:UDP-D-apiose/UDP-D-xylose synthase 2 [Zostera marina]
MHDRSFIGSHLCEKLMFETSHTVIGVDVYNDKIFSLHLLEPVEKENCTWFGRIQFHRMNIKHDSRLEALIKMSDLAINLAAICTLADYNTRLLNTIYSNFIDALPVMKYCGEYSKRLIHFSTCEVYGKTTIGSFNSSQRSSIPSKEETPYIFGSIQKQRWSYACAKQLIEKIGLRLQKLVDGGESQRTFIYIKDAVEAMTLMIENPDRANGHIFNVDA